MIYKIIFLTLFLFTFSNAEHQEVRIGTIDNYYASKITKTQLKEMLDEIETQFESQLGFDVFNYSKNGKPIDIIYMPDIKLEKQIERKTKRLQRKKEKIDELRRFFPDEQVRIDTYQKNLNKFAAYINKMTISLNSYITKANKRRDFNSSEYKKTQLYVETKQKRIKREIKNLRKERRTLRRMLDSYNKKIHSLNRLVNGYNTLNNQITRMSRSVKKVKGKTFGLKEVSLKTYYKDGKKVKEKTVKTSMTKIEVYGFESKAKLKVILAHEIAHLVGIPHINVKNALMNPILQQSQIDNLSLIKEDIRNFKRNF